MLRAAMFLEAIGADIMIHDADIWFSQNPHELYRPFAASDLAMMRRPEGLGYMPWRAVSAEALYLRNTPIGRSAAADLSSIMAYHLSKITSEHSNWWWIDQNALHFAWEYYRSQAIQFGEISYSMILVRSIILLKHEVRREDQKSKRRETISTQEELSIMLHTKTASLTNFDTSGASPIDGLQFLWLELTNVCNLRCTHCYAESGPHPDRADLLSTADFERLLKEAAAIGCRAVQFIGGEATLHPGLPQLIARARDLGYEFVEVYTNATRLPPALLACFVRHSVSLAVSVYADDAAVHDTVNSPARFACQDDRQP